MLKSTKVFVSTGLLIGASMVFAGSLDLEPCMNGEVSANGAYPSDAAELQFYAVAEQEPCMNGAVPADGLLASTTETQPVVVHADRR